MNTEPSTSATKHLTTEATIDFIPVVGKPLIRVAAGVPVEFAISHAQILEKHVSAMLLDLVHCDPDRSPDIAYVCGYLHASAMALREAAGQVV